MARRREVGWRDRAAAELLLDYLSAAPLSGPALVAGGRVGAVVERLQARGLEARVWARWAGPGVEARPWPPVGLHALALLRLPRSKEELDMCLHALAAGQAPTGTLLLYGAGDEGVVSAARRLAPFYSAEGVVAVGGRCRVIRAVRTCEVKGLRSSLGAWKTVVRLDHPLLPKEWISYPGLFAHGRLDPGTRLLLDALPPLAGARRVLDYGCGSGALAAAVRKRSPDAMVHMLDHDALALAAAEENVPGAIALLRAGLPSPEEGRYDLILSNPPLHRGREEDPALLASFVEEAAPLLAPAGRLLMVVQGRIALRRLLADRFADVAVVAEDRRFRVWSCGVRMRGEGRTASP